MSVHTDEPDADQIRGRPGTKDWKPAHTGKPMPELHRLRIIRGTRRRQLLTHERRYRERRLVLLSDLENLELRIAELEAGQDRGAVE